MPAVDPHLMTKFGIFKRFMTFNWKWNATNFLSKEWKLRRVFIFNHNSRIAHEINRKLRARKSLTFFLRRSRNVNEARKTKFKLGRSTRYLRLLPCKQLFGSGILFDLFEVFKEVFLIRRSSIKGESLWPPLQESKQNCNKRKKKSKWKNDFVGQ